MVLLIKKALFCFEKWVLELWMLDLTLFLLFWSYTKKYDVMLYIIVIYIAKHNKWVISITEWLYMLQSLVTQSCDIEKVVKCSEIDDIIYYNLGLKVKTKVYSCIE